MNGINADVKTLLQVTTTTGAARTPRRTSRRRGPGRSTRRSSGPNKSRRSSAARGKASSSCGPTASKTRGGIRKQFHHVIDVAPTILEAAGISPAAIGRRRGAAADRGHEHALHVRRSERATRRARHHTQYFEMVGVPGDVSATAGWRASFRVCPPWDPFCKNPNALASVGRTPKWELYNVAARLDADTTTSRRSIPTSCKELQELFVAEAGKYNVFPLNADKPADGVLAASRAQSRADAVSCTTRRSSTCRRRSRPTCSTSRTRSPPT